MKKKETKKLTKDEMVKNIEKLKKDLFNFRFQKINGEVKNPAKISEINTLEEKKTEIFWALCTTLQQLLC